MTAITITPRNKKELQALKDFIKINDLTYEESVAQVKANDSAVNSILKIPKELQRELNNCITIDEFSSKSTSFLECLSWSK